MTRISFQEEPQVPRCFDKILSVDDVMTFETNKKSLCLVKEHGSIVHHVTNARVYWL